jgi:hypothetical protein
MFPGCEAAGMVKQREGDTVRHLTPVYYFRVPLPKGFSHEAGGIELAKEDAARASVRMDRPAGLLHVVYLPEREKPGQTIVLRLTRRMDFPIRPGQADGLGKPSYDPSRRGGQDGRVPRGTAP